MSTHTLRTSVSIPVSIQQAWSFFSNPRNLASITPPEMGFDIISHDLPQSMFSGQIVEYVVRPFFGIPMRWVSELKHVREPEFFVDEQLVGPYRLWYHSHIFRSVPSGTQITDHVVYALPFGPLGHLVHAILVAQRLESIFAYRKNALETRFGRISSSMTA